MDRRGQPRARYEDDILAFLMDGMLEDEGRVLLEENERLNAEPAAAIPAELDERCRALLQSAFPDEPLKKPERATWKIMKRVLIAAVIAATMFVTACAASKGQNPVPEPRDTAEVTEMTIHGMPGYFAHGNRHISDSEFIRYMWFDEERGLRYTYRSMGIPYEESQKIFEGLVIQK